jgi:hypothetical protein
LFQIEKEGIQGKTWNGGLNVLAEIDGYANYIYQVDKIKGAKYKSQVGAILKAHSYKENHAAKYVSNSTEATNEHKVPSFFKKIISFFKK